MKINYRQTVMMQAIRNAGWRKGMKATVMLACWVLQTLDQGEEPRIWDDYIAYWKISRNVWYAEITAFKEAFPGYEHPRELVAALDIDIEPIQETDREVAAAYVGALEWTVA